MSIITAKRINIDEINKDSEICAQKIVELLKDYKSLVATFCKLHKYELDHVELDQIILSATLYLVREVVALVIDNMTVEGKRGIISWSEGVFKSYMDSLKEGIKE